VRWKGIFIRKNKKKLTTIFFKKKFFVQMTSNGIAQIFFFEKTKILNNSYITHRSLKPLSFAYQNLFIYDQR
jgi:hypothetical protein